jgi:hypothetical protein
MEFYDKADLLLFNGRPVKTLSRPQGLKFYKKYLFKGLNSEGSISLFEAVNAGYKFLQNCMYM